MKVLMRILLLVALFLGLVIAMMTWSEYSNRRFRHADQQPQSSVQEMLGKK